MTGALLLTIPVRVHGPNGSHGHWSVAAKRRRDLKSVTLMALRCNVGQVAPVLPATVVITRVGKQRMDDDNVAFACKGLRDAVAEWLGIDDGDERVTWVYRARTGKAYAVEIELRKGGIE